MMTTLGVSGLVCPRLVSLALQFLTLHHQFHHLQLQQMMMMMKKSHLQHILLITLLPARDQAGMMISVQDVMQHVGGKIDPSGVIAPHGSRLTGSQATLVVGMTSPLLHRTSVITGVNLWSHQLKHPVLNQSMQTPLLRSLLQLMLQVISYVRLLLMMTTRLCRVSKNQALGQILLHGRSTLGSGQIEQLTSPKLKIKMWTASHTLRVMKILTTTQLQSPVKKQKLAVILLANFQQQRSGVVTHQLAGGLLVSQAKHVVVDLVFVLVRISVLRLELLRQQPAQRELTLSCSAQL